MLDSGELSQIEAQLIRHEGLRLMPYKCPAGKLTIGVGRNLTDVGLTREEALTLLRNDIARCESALKKRFTWWPLLNEPRKRALVDLCFNLGMGSLLAFKDTLKALSEGRYGDAANHLRASKWSQQVQPARVMTITYLVEFGRDPSQKEKPC